MRRAERLFRLVNELRARGLARADDLADSFEVSTRTIYRDIAHLQGSGLPIDGAAGVGYMLRPGFDLPEMTFTHEQVEALALGLAFAESLDDPDLAAAAREVRAKLQASLPDPGDRKLADVPFFSLRRTTGAPQHAALLRKAIRQRRIVALGYAGGSGAPSDRLVQPLVVWTFEPGWMVSGWCELRQDFRTFRLDRITRCALTNERFPDDPARGLRALLARESCDSPAVPRT
jgi:predicted DNA-binding transcriptional regulator YafY